MGWCYFTVLENASEVVGGTYIDFYYDEISLLLAFLSLVVCFQVVSSVKSQETIGGASYYASSK